MVFSSTIFLFAFLPLFLAVYFLIPNKVSKNAILLVFSLGFYAWGEPIYIWLMIFSIIFNWAFGFAISKSHHSFVRRLLLSVDIILNITIIGFYKYESFLAFNINQVLGEDFIAELDLALPIGISFFTLQAITYVVDVYRSKASAQRNPLYLGMYIAMFPQLVAGPIVRYVDIENEINNRRATLVGFSQGLRLFVIGLGKKVLLADVAGLLADSLLQCSAPSIGFVGCFSGIAAYTFQIYFDFSGYSDMAIGLGKMIGFDFPRNFNYPYISKSATEFWRRWHISLGSFFRDYVYIPLGGNRVSAPHLIFNTMVVWALTGIWHGAAWNFLFWGLYWGVLILIEKFLLAKLFDRLPNALAHIWCIILFFFGWLLFAVTGLDNVAQWGAALFGAYGLTGLSTFWELQSWEFISFVPIMIIGSLPWAPWARQKLEAWAEGDSQKRGPVVPIEGFSMVPPCQIEPKQFATSKHQHSIGLLNCLIDIALLSIFVLSIISIVTSGYNPFIYFQF